MQPLLYKSTALSPGEDTMQYLGRLTKCEKCVVSEQLNDDYSVKAVFLPTDELIDEIWDQRFLMAKPSPFDPPQFFEICGSEYDEIGRLAVSGRHIKHCCYNNVVYSDYESSGLKTPANHWAYVTQRGGLCFDTHFTFDSDITDANSMTVGYRSAETLGKFLEEMAERFGGEYHYDNFNISLLRARGSRKNYVLRWNRNIGSPVLSLSTADIYSHVVAYGDFTYNGNTVRIVSPTPASLTGTTSQLYRVFMYNATGHFANTTISDMRAELSGIQSSLNSWASYYRSHGAKNDLQSTENVNLRVDYRPALDEMTAVGLGDTVDVMLKGGRTVEAKITKTEFDSLAERWTAIELGKEKLKLSKYIARSR
jgi:phage-related protein